MPRPKLLKNTSEYRGYKIKETYQYNKTQLDTIIDALNYYADLSNDKTNIDNLNSNYMVFDITIKFTSPITVNDDPFDCDIDDGSYIPFNFADLSKVLDRDYFYYRYTKEMSDHRKKKKKGVDGSHCHIMVIGNNVDKTIIFNLRKQIAQLDGVSSAHVSQRGIEKGDLRKKQGYFHYLNKSPRDYIDGLNDCVDRMSYRAKIDQKENVRQHRTYDGTRILKPLKPSKKLEYKIAPKLILMNDGTYKKVA